MNRIKCFSLIGLCVVAVVSTTISGAQRVQREKVRVINVLNQSDYEVRVYFSKDDAKMNQNVKQYIYKSVDGQIFELYVPSSEIRKVYLQCDGFDRFLSVPVHQKDMKMIHVTSSGDPDYPFGLLFRA